MNARAKALTRRQNELLRRSGELRHQFAEDAQAWQRPLAVADRVHAGWRWLRAHPEVPLAAAAVVVIMRPRRAWRLAWRVWTGWRLLRSLQRQPLPSLQRPVDLMGLMGLVAGLMRRR